MNRRTFLKLLAVPVAVAAFPDMAIPAESEFVFKEVNWDYNRCLGICLEAHKDGVMHRNAINLGNIESIAEEDVDRAKIILLEWGSRL